MHRKADNNNKRARQSVQILQAKNDTKTLLNFEKSTQRSRAKYQASPKLLTLIEQTNILPPKLKFDWNEEYEKHGFNLAFKHWEEKLLSLSVAEHIRLLTAVLDERDEIFENSQPTAKVTKKGLMRFSQLALEKAIKIFEIRQFLKNLYIFHKVSQEKEITDLVDKNQSVLDVWNKLFRNLDNLYELPASRKYARYIREAFINLNTRYRKGITVYLTVRAIGLNEKDNFGCNDEEAAEFFEAFTKSFVLRETNQEYANKLFVLLDLFAEFTIFLESKDLKSSVAIDKSGNVEFRPSPYVEALQGMNISRLRMCEYCMRFFWAIRKDAFTCSPKHARNRRMKLLRENWKEKGDLYLKARQKKAKKQKEIKSNGSL